MSNFRGFLKIKLPAFLFFLWSLPSFQYRNFPFGDPRLYLRQVKPDQPPNLDEGDFPLRHIFPQGRPFYGGTPFQFRYINQMFHRSLPSPHSAGPDEPTIAGKRREQNVQKVMVLTVFLKIKRFICSPVHSGHYQSS
jgi:hypothetical protein